MNKTFNQQINSSSTRHPESILGSYQCKEQTLCIHTPQMLKQVQHDKCLVNDDNSTTNCNFFKAFTLAEVMIVLAVIGILTAILLPVAHNATPNENILKFKKAHNTLHTTIRELVNSDEYYLNGDLGVKSDGNFVDSPTYFCETLVDIVNIKKANCLSQDNSSFASGFEDIKNDNIKTQMDAYCKIVETKIEGEIFFDDFLIYQTNPAMHFAWKIEENGLRLFGNVNVDSNGFDRVYKIFCIDIDKTNQGEDSFGYGIRADGKILNGARAEEWLQKTIQEK